MLPEVDDEFVESQKPLIRDLKVLVQKHEANELDVEPNGLLRCGIVGNEDIMGILAIHRLAVVAVD